ncbi:MAG: DNA-binding response regulator [Leifsonia xyli]|nr:MAG: DNA-binding response regulator [Leifsonia xyli]
MSIPTTAPSALTRPDGSPVRALVVDDEPSLGELIQMALRYEGWQVETATDGASALTKARTFQPDVIVLDIMMPGLDGLEVLRRLRSGGDEVAVLFLTAKDAVNDRVIGLTAGGDDYVTKPFSLEEVVARLRSLLRRTGRAVSGYTDPVLRVGDLTLDEESYEVTRGGRPIELTAKEFELLRYLMRNPRRVVSKLQILDRVWSYDFEGRSSIVEIYISYLRKKIEGEGMPPLIHTVRGVGYLIKPAA